jgi:hypothetical protein
MKIIVPLIVLILTPYVAWGENFPNPPGGVFSSLTVEQTKDYLIKMMLQEKALNANLKAQEYVSDCKSNISYNLQKYTRSTDQSLIEEFVCHDDPSHQASVQVKLNQGDDLDQTSMPVISFERE